MIVMRFQNQNGKFFSRPMSNLVCFKEHNPIDFSTHMDVFSTVLEMHYKYFPIQNVRI